MILHGIPSHDNVTQTFGSWSYQVVQLISSFLAAGLDEIILLFMIYAEIEGTKWTLFSVHFSV